MKIGHWVPAYNEQVHSCLIGQIALDATACAQAGHSWRFWSTHSCDLVWSRNNSLDKALHIGLDYLFCQDSDVYSPVDGGPLIRMLETAIATEATIVSPIVSLRTRPIRANVWPVLVGEKYEADKVGSGMILIDLNRVREWYSRHESPCFSRTYDDPKGIVQHVGMDIFFSYVVRQYGGRIVVDGTLPTVHVDQTAKYDYDGSSIPDSAG